MIRWDCPKCREPLEAPESMVGQPIQCPSCANVSAAQIGSPVRAAANYPAMRSKPNQTETGLRVLIWSIVLLGISLLAYGGNFVLAQSGDPSPILSLIGGVCGLAFVVFLLGGLIRVLIGASS